MVRWCGIRVIVQKAIQIIKELKPISATAIIRGWANAWMTSSRVPHVAGVQPCVFHCCVKGAKDSLSHYLVCPALWGMAEAINGSTGLAHTEADCLGYFKKAGFTNIGVHEFVAGTLSRITGTKPA